MKFVNKRDIVEGIQYIGNLEEITEFVGSAAKIKEEFNGVYLIDKYNKTTKIYKNNYLIKANNRVSICDSDKFADSYLEFKENESTIKVNDFTLSNRDKTIIREEFDKLADKYNVHISLKSVDSINIMISLTDDNFAEPVYTNLSTDYFVKSNEFNARKYVYNVVEDFILRETSNWVQC